MMTPNWVRLGLVAVGAPQLAAGLWAIFDTRGWYDDFPGLGTGWVAADGPYNAHLATDAGAGLFATSVALLLAAAWGRRREVTLALAVFLAMAVPHLTYHVRNPAPGLTDGQNAQSTTSLAISVALPLVLLWGNRSPTASEPTTSRRAEPASAG